MLINFIRILGIILYLRLVKRLNLSYINSKHNYLPDCIFQTLIFGMASIHKCEIINHNLQLKSLKDMIIEETSPFASILADIYKTKCQNGEVSTEIQEKIDFKQKYTTLSSYILDIYDYLVHNNVLSKEEKLDLSNMNVKNLPLDLPTHWVSLKKLILEGNRALCLSHLDFEILASKLEELDVSECNLDYEDVKKILETKWTNLKKLNLRENKSLKFSNLCLNSLATKLEKMDISNCELDDEDIKTIMVMKWSKLKQLNLSGNKILKLTYPCFQSQPKPLEELDISGCDYDGNDLKDKILFEFGSLKKLNLKGNKRLKIEYLCFMPLASKLEELDVSECDLDYEDLREILSTKWEILKCLILRGNKELKLTNLCFKSICYKLEKLDVSDCDLESNDIEELSNCTNLTWLDISNNQRLSLCENLNISSWSRNLNHLALSQIGLKKRDFLALTKLKKLEILDLSNNQLGSYLCRISNLGRLKESLISLNLRNTGFLFKDIKKLHECLKLKKLDISYNNLASSENLRSYLPNGKIKNTLHLILPFFKVSTHLGRLKSTLEILNIENSFIDESYHKEIFSCPYLKKLYC